MEWRPSRCPGFGNSWSRVERARQTWQDSSQLCLRKRTLVWRRVVKVLVAAGAELNLPDCDGLSALMLASVRGHHAHWGCIRVSGGWGQPSLQYLYIIYERPKWTIPTFLRKRLNRSGRFWYQIKSMDVLRVICGLDFAYSPRGPRPSPLKREIR